MARTFLDLMMKLRRTIQAAVTANNIEEREDNIVLAQKMLADLHNELKITDPVNVKIENYFNRDIKVIFADNTPLADYPFIGTLSEVGNFVSLSDNPQYREQVKSLYVSHTAISK